MSGLLLLVLIVAVVGFVAFTIATERHKQIGAIRGVFRVPLVPWLVAWSGAPIVFALAMVWSMPSPGAWNVVLMASGVGSALLALSIAAGVVTWRIATWKVGDEGIAYGFGRTLWADVVDARVRRLFWLPHVRIHRHRGLRWDVPLWFVGNGDFRDTLIGAVPADNPLHRCLNEAHLDLHPSTVRIAVVNFIVFGGVPLVVSFIAPMLWK